MCNTRSGGMLRCSKTQTKTQFPDQNSNHKAATTILLKTPARPSTFHYLLSCQIKTALSTAEPTQTYNINAQNQTIEPCPSLSLTSTHDIMLYIQVNMPHGIIPHDQITHNQRVSGKIYSSHEHSNYIVERSSWPVQSRVLCR